MDPNFAPRLNFAQIAERMVAEVNAGDIFGWVAFAELTEAELIGYVTARFVGASEDCMQGPYLYFLDLDVRHASRRGGVATALVQEALRHARHQGVSRAEVSWLPADPGASAFWAREGFTPYVHRGCLELPDQRSRPDTITIERLADHPEVLTTLQRWFEAEWPSWYGPGGPGSAAADLHSFAGLEGLPRAVVAFSEGEVCGVAALKAASIASHAHLSPWAAAGFVEPSRRCRGIGAQLLAALEREARNLGFARIYCGTGRAQSLLERCGWQLLERVTHDGQSLSIYSKAL